MIHEKFHYCKKLRESRISMFCSEFSQFSGNYAGFTKPHSLILFCTIDMPYHYRYHITQLRHHYPWNCKHSSLFLVFSLRKYQNLFNRKHMCLRKMLCLSILSLLYVSNHNAVILVLHNVQPKNPRDNWMSSKSGIGTQVVWYYVYFCLRIQ